MSKNNNKTIYPQMSFLFQDPKIVFFFFLNDRKHGYKALNIFNLKMVKIPLKSFPIWRECPWSEGTGHNGE